MLWKGEKQSNVKRRRRKKKEEKKKKEEEEEEEKKKNLSQWHFVYHIFHMVWSEIELKFA